MIISYLKSSKSHFMDNCKVGINNSTTVFFEVKKKSWVSHDISLGSFLIAITMYPLTTGHPLLE